MVVEEDFAMPTVGFVTDLDTFRLGVRVLGLGDVCESVVVGTGCCTSAGIEMLG